MQSSVTVPMEHRIVQVPPGYFPPRMLVRAPAGCTVVFRKHKVPMRFMHSLTLGGAQVSRCVEEVLQETLNVLAATEDEEAQLSRQVRPCARPSSFLPPP